jgi:DNA anti-recombination protein RmuC
MRMPVTARLSKRFYDTFGDEIANDLVDWFNQVDATYRQELREQNDLNWGRVEARISQAEARIAQAEGRFDARMAEFEARMNAQLAALRADLRAEFHQELTGLRADVDVGLERLRSDLLKWMFLYWTGTALTVIGLVIALRR